LNYFPLVPALKQRFEVCRRHRRPAAAILAATRHWPLSTPTDGDGDEAENQRAISERQTEKLGEIFAQLRDTDDTIRRNVSGPRDSPLQPQNATVLRPQCCFGPFFANPVN